MAELIRDIQNTNNQSFSILLEDDFYEITIKTVGRLSYLTVVRNGDTIVSNRRAVPNVNIIPNRHQFQEHGNFRFVGDDSYPFFENFNVSTRLYYVTKQEVIDGN